MQLDEDSHHGDFSQRARDGQLVERVRAWRGEASMVYGHTYRHSEAGRFDTCAPHPVLVCTDNIGDYSRREDSHLMSAELSTGHCALFPSRSDEYPPRCSRE